MEFLLHTLVDGTWEENEALALIYPDSISEYQSKLQYESAVIKVEDCSDDELVSIERKNQPPSMEETLETDINIMDSSVSYNGRSSKSINPSQCTNSQDAAHSLGLGTSRTSDTAVCSYCNKSFHNKRYMRRHILIHTGEKPYSCKQCSFRCTQKSSLTCHMRTHTGERPFTCDVCGKSFVASSHLNRHALTHTGEKPYTCPQCGATFTRNGNLKDHLLIHNGVKSHACETCGKMFLKRNHLLRHLRTLCGEKLNVCMVCGKRYKQLSGLKNHSRMCQNKSLSKPSV